MECIIPGNNMKVLGRALQALAKIGDELFMEATKDRLFLITLNLSKTVYARFQFLDTFFSCYEINQDELDAATDEKIRCKMHMKILLPLFRGNLDKKLDFVKLEYTTDSDFFTLKMKYKCDEIVMVHNLRLMDSETLSIGVMTDSGSNNLAADSPFYNQLLSMFSITDDELTFEITPTKIVARNYCVGTPCRPKMMRTQINLNSTDFSSYKITKDTSINFSLKPFRTVVHFAEQFNLDINFNFEIGGKPLSIILKNPTFEVDFIVATSDPYTDTNSSIATTTTAPSKTKETASKKDQITEGDFEAMEAENWESTDLSSKDSSFVDLMKKARNTKPNVDVIPRSPESPRYKKAKTVFGRCYDPTFHETILGEVLAANSDSE